MKKVSMKKVYLLLYLKNLFVLKISNRIFLAEQEGAGGGGSRRRRSLAYRVNYSE
jgi:hypothetical protein